MTESNRAQPGPRSPAARSSPLYSVETLSHALSERLTAMLHYFAAARGYFDKGEVAAAQEAFAHYLEQSERARDIAEAIRDGMEEYQP